MNKPNSLPSQQIEESLERFRARFVGGKRADPKTYEFRVFRNIEAFLKKELEACMERARKEAVEDKLIDGHAYTYLHSVNCKKCNEPNSLRNCKCHCHCECGGYHGKNNPLYKYICEHCKPKGEDK